MALRVLQLPRRSLRRYAIFDGPSTKPSSGRSGGPTSTVGRGWAVTGKSRHLARAACASASEHVTTSEWYEDGRPLAGGQGRVGPDGGSFLGGGQDNGNRR